MRSPIPTTGPSSALVEATREPKNLLGCLVSRNRKCLGHRCTTRAAWHGSEFNVPSLSQQDSSLFDPSKGWPTVRCAEHINFGVALIQRLQRLYPRHQLARDGSLSGSDPVAVRFRPSQVPGLARGSYGCRTTGAW